MSERMTIRFAPAEGAVVRMLGLVERRGYELERLSMSENDNKGLLVLDLQPRDSNRRAHVVAEQLLRLVDVHSVSLSTRDAGASE